MNPADIAGRPELVLQTGHASRVDGIAFSPDGTLLASGSADNTIKLWDTASRREVRTLAGNAGGIKAVAFRPDGQLLASGGIDGKITFWEVGSGKETRSFPGSGSVTTLAFSSDGQRLAAGNMEQTIRLVDLASGSVRSLTGHNGLISAITFSADGRWLASGSADKTVRVWDLNTGSAVKTLSGHNDRITALAFSADGQLLASGGADAKVRLWSVGQWRERQVQFEGAGKLAALAFSSDGGSLISADVKKTIRVTDVASGRIVSSLATAGEDDLAETIAATFSPDGRWLASSTGDKTIALRDTATGRDRQVLTTHSYSVYASAFSSGGHWLATGGKENTVKVWEVATGREINTLDPRGGFVNAVAFSPDERLLAAGTLSGKIALWEVMTGQLLGTLAGHAGGVNSVAFDPAGNWLVSGGTDRTVRLWSVAERREVRTPTRHADEVMSVVFSPDGKQIVSGSVDKTIKIWDAATGSEVRTLTGHKDAVLSVAISADGRSIASGSADNSVKLWDTSTGREARSLTGHSAEVKAVAFAVDGRSLVSGSRDNTVKLWEVATGNLINTLRGHTSEIYSLAFTADGRWFVSASDDGSTRLWDAKTGDWAASIISLRESAGGYAFDQSDWLVVAPDGLFDGSPAAWRQILWRFDQSSTNVRPVEIFFNEFFYPGLLADILAGKKPRAPKDIAQIDRRQPNISLSLVDGQTNRAQAANRNLAVRIQVTEARPDQSHPLGSGARDVRLFRNGSLIKVWRGDALQNRGSNALLETTIPVIAGPNELTAYVFNRDNIKSNDSTVLINGADSLKRPATAYLIAVGLNAYANADYNLKYAVPDANDFGEEVRRNEEKLLGRFANVVTIPLYDQDATKGNILAAVHRLASDDPLPAGVPMALQKLKVAQPEDAVVIFFAGHGVASGNTFYMLPHDLGYNGPRQRLNPDGLDSIIRHGVSDRELERALEGISATQILLVIDACNSGQALDAEEKRRGPMNSKGLAQLAYEKGMYVMAAAQSYQAALEAAELGHGLLTYALVEEGLKQVAADRAPKDGRVFLKEWFDFATSRVPQLQQEKMRNGRGLGLAFVEGDEDLDPAKRRLQRPRAFYRRDLPVPLIAVTQQATR